MITYETRQEAHRSVDKAKRYSQILEILTDLGPLTAKEVAVELHRRGFTGSDDRNMAAPRLTEMLQDGKVKVICKAKCLYTGKTVAVFERVKVEKQLSFI